METKRMTFMAACRDYFGLFPDQKPLDFGREVKALTDDDRKEIIAGLEKLGYEIIPSTTA